MIISYINGEWKEPGSLCQAIGIFKENFHKTVSVVGGGGKTTVIRRLMDECRNAGMDNHISKPISLEQFKSCMARFAVSGQFASDATALAEEPPPQIPAGYDYLAAIGRADQEIVEIIAGQFIETAPGELSQLKLSLKACDISETLRLAHTLKGILAAFNADPAALLAEEIEQRCTRGSMAGCQSLSVLLEREVLSLCNSLKPFVSERVHEITQ